MDETNGEHDSSTSINRLEIPICLICQESLEGSEGDMTVILLTEVIVVISICMRVVWPELSRITVINAHTVEVLLVFLLMVCRNFNEYAENMI